MAHKFSNNASTVLSSSITSGSTSLTVTSGGGALFPTLGASDFMLLTLEDASANFEIIKCSSRSGDVFQSIERAYEGTTARAFEANDRLELRFTAGTIDLFIQKDGDIIDGGTF